MAEFEWIAQYFRPLISEPGAANLEDDVAELGGAGSGRVITTDALVEGIHFLASDPLDTVARKLVRVNVSDILAKGARPQEALLTLGWPKGRDPADLADFARGLGRDLEHFGLSLLGGDTVSTTGPLFVSLTLTGQCLARGPVRRSGGRPGDAIYVTGAIGAAGLGLADARIGRDSVFSAAYRVPQVPPLAMAGLVARFARAAMDISDGLLGDAAKLAAASRCRAEIALDTVPLAAPLADLRGKLQQVAFGDDYQVLLALDPALAGPLEVAASDAAISLTRIGQLVEGAGLTLTQAGQSVALPDRLGHEHR